MKNSRDLARKIVDDLFYYQSLINRRLIDYKEIRKEWVLQMIDDLERDLDNFLKNNKEVA
jgi:hypothetical protein